MPFDAFSIFTFSQLATAFSNEGLGCISGCLLFSLSFLVRLLELALTSQWTICATYQNARTSTRNMNVEKCDCSDRCLDGTFFNVCGVIEAIFFQLRLLFNIFSSSFSDSSEASPRGKIYKLIESRNILYFWILCTI